MWSKLKVLVINLHQIVPGSMRNSFSKTVKGKRGLPAYAKLNSASLNPCISYWRDIIWQRLRRWLFTCLGFIRRTSSRKSMSSNPTLKNLGIVPQNRKLTTVLARLRCQVSGERCKDDLIPVCFGSDSLTHIFVVVVLYLPHNKLCVSVNKKNPL